MDKTKLREFILRHKMTCPQFARLMGVTGMAVQHWLDGRRQMSLTMTRLCKLFDAHPELMSEFVK